MVLSCVTERYKTLRHKSHICFMSSTLFAAQKFTTRLQAHYLHANIQTHIHTSTHTHRDRLGVPLPEGLEHHQLRSVETQRILLTANNDFRDNNDQRPKAAPISINSFIMSYETATVTGSGLHRPSQAKPDSCCPSAMANQALLCRNCFHIKYKFICIFICP